MKEYIVTVSSYLFLVSAKDVKDAINQVYETLDKEFDKSLFKSKSVGSLHNQYGKVVSLK